ncbi:hypothetical protein Taro_018050, partial [Colocasia esculenta]|nr:hypothetical protein [Colocasia esculenta]
YNRLIDHVGIHGQRRLTEALNKDSLVRQKEYPSKSSSKSRKRVIMETSAQCSRGVLEQWSIEIGYNWLIDHVKIHRQRRLTEALNKDSLVRQKEYPSESSSKSRKRVIMEKVLDVLEEF